MRRQQWLFIVTIHLIACSHAVKLCQLWNLVCQAYVRLIPLFVLSFNCKRIPFRIFRMSGNRLNFTQHMILNRRENTILEENSISNGWSWVDKFISYRWCLYLVCNDNYLLWFFISFNEHVNWLIKSADIVHTTLSQKRITSVVLNYFRPVMINMNACVARNPLIAFFTRLPKLVQNVSMITCLKRHLHARVWDLSKIQSMLGFYKIENSWKGNKADHHWPRPVSDQFFVRRQQDSVSLRQNW